MRIQFEYGKQYILYSGKNRHIELLKCTGIQHDCMKARFENGKQLYLAELTIENGVEIAQIIKPIQYNMIKIRSDDTINKKKEWKNGMMT